MIAYIISALVLGAAIILSRTKNLVHLFSSLFYALQIGFVAWIATCAQGQTSSLFFTFDTIGTLFFGLVAIVSPLVFYHSIRYLDNEQFAHYRLYNLLLTLLCVAISGVYFANNVAVTWIFLEATTLCTAGIIYHRRTEQSLEATWKYIFVCSTGIAIAYLGILLLSTVATNGELSYTNLEQLVASGNPLYLKIAFLFILVGYSCKMEIFPLYTIGIDANSAAPAPASALISTGLVNAGFIAIFRVYRVMSQSEVFGWVSNVMIVTGVVSLLIGALYLRRTNNYKRLLSYSTVENMGIVCIGMGVGGVGLWAAILHIIAHTLIKSGMFLQMDQVGKTYGTYRINRIGNYMNISRIGATTLIVGLVLLLAFPPSPLFISEIMILKQIIINGQWWLLTAMVMLICLVIYSFSSQILKLCYKTEGNNHEHVVPHSLLLSWLSLGLIILAIVVGLWQPEAMVEYIDNIVNFNLL